MLRPGLAADLPCIERLLRESGLPIEGVAEAFARQPADFLVGEAAGAGGASRPIAVAGLEVYGSVALFRSAAVDPAWRSHGLGARLMRGLIALAESRSVAALYLLTTTAEEYFPRFGFTRVRRADVPEAIARTSEFQTACPQSATVMMRSVSPTSSRSAHASS
ncbi:MAG TPA: arsenic resistance N-acetyltransferase ArsN2 [Gemmatimonadaceae bacterium]|nr:arsenic resistance N-acetyltransferase ArsN2 [Gemmatimonadaceae bacterium]